MWEPDRPFGRSYDRGTSLKEEIRQPTRSRGHQPQGGKGSRAHDPAVSAGAGRSSDRLAVKPHEVVCSQDPGDRGMTAETRVAPVPVVVVQPGPECRPALLRVPVDARIRPFQQRRLDESLDLAVRAGRIAPRPQM